MSAATKGQTWRRKRDGVEVVLVNVSLDIYDNSPVDCYWETVDKDKPARRGVIYVTNLYDRYEFVK